MYQNPGQEMNAGVYFIPTKEFHFFLHLATKCIWRNYPSPVVGAFLFLALWICFAWHGIESIRTAADLAGTAIFAFTGCLVGFRQFKRVSFWIALAAGIAGGFITAVGGGTIRTLLLGLELNNLFWIENHNYLIAIALGLLLAMFWEPKLCACCEAHWDSADRIALAVFAPLGAEKALVFGAAPTITVVMMAVLFGFLTGAGGGVFRDILRMRPPMALFTTYGWIAAVGAAVHIFLFQAGIPMAWVVSAAVIYLLAESTHKHDWRLHIIRH